MKKGKPGQGEKDEGKRSGRERRRGGEEEKGKGS